ncbi:hypothetical protein Taro_048519 [Colocasia esculenta]|uniref:Uncharacterized protein n=1 Tax=Colocasia esculenta TaxID=4460 RepID=A0A843X8C2_COLES|nr:hypothetical protein [Colocasia esculenta]
MVLLTWLLAVSRGDPWLFLPDLVEVRDVGACVLLLHVFECTGSVGVMFGPTLVVVVVFTLFRCFVVLCGRRFSLYFFVE